jgi:hypothetical protein
MSLTTQLVRRGAVLGAGLLLISVVGCGGANGGGLPSRAEFIERGSAICSHTVLEARAAAPSTIESLPLANRSSYVEPVMVRPMANELRRLRALDLPPGEAKEIKPIFRAIAKGLKDAKLDPLDPLVKATDPFAPANRLAREYGLKACAASSHAVIRPGTFAQLYGTEK